MFKLIHKDEGLYFDCKIGGLILINSNGREFKTRRQARHWKRFKKLNEFEVKKVLKKVSIKL